MTLPSLWGWLDRIPYWNNLPYPTKSALLRAIKAGASVAVAILLAAATQGILFPASFSPGVVLAVTMVLQSVDKFLRETDIENKAIAAAATQPDVEASTPPLNTP